MFIRWPGRLMYVSCADPGVFFFFLPPPPPPGKIFWIRACVYDELIQIARYTFLFKSLQQMIDNYDTLNFNLYWIK